MAKHGYSDQDIRNEVIELRDELIANLKFMTKVIAEDRDALEKYHKEHGDVQYRPKIGLPDAKGYQQWGNPTEVVLEPLASKYRATINSLLQSIRLINAEILPEENPEGTSAAGEAEENERSQERKKSLRDRFAAGAGTTEPVEADEEESSEKLVPTTNIGSIEANKPAIESPKETEPKSKPRPWRETVPSKAPVHKSVVVEPPPPKELSPLEKERQENADKLKKGLESVKAKFGQSTNRMDSIKSKYLKRDNSEDE